MFSIVSLSVLCNQEKFHGLSEHQYPQTQTADGGDRFCIGKLVRCGGLRARREGLGRKDGGPWNRLGVQPWPRVVGPSGSLQPMKAVGDV